MIQAFKYYLLGAPFVLITDHAPLHWLNRMKDLNARLTHWYLNLKPFAFQIQYKKGQVIANADYFSWQGSWEESNEERTAHSSGGRVSKRERKVCHPLSCPEESLM